MKRSVVSALLALGATCLEGRLLAGGAAPAFQSQPLTPPTRHGESLRLGGDSSRYQIMYGKPEFRGIDDEVGRPWPIRSAIRTAATLEEIRQGPGLAEGGVDYANSYAYYMLCGRRHCLAIVPVEEMQDFFATQAPAWVHREVGVIGAIDQVPVADPRARMNPPTGFLVWSVEEVGAGGRRKASTGGSSLEALVTGPEAARGGAITVSGVFRGANLFEDLPPETRRGPADWVLKDGPFSVWVTGKLPRGSGWALDPASRSDCTWRLEVKGRVEQQGDYVYLRAQKVTLTGRAKDNSDPSP
jgi:hypothetical protein